MPYESQAQERWAHTPNGEKALGGKAAVHEWDEATKGKELPEKKMSKPKHTSIEHHEDGSHTIHHKHKHGHETSHAVADDAGLMAHMGDMLGQGGGEEAAAPPQAGPAGMPPGAAPQAV